MTLDELEVSKSLDIIELKLRKRIIYILDSLKKDVSNGEYENEVFLNILTKRLTSLRELENIRNTDDPDEED